MITQDMIDDCINFPVASRDHNFTREEEVGYRNLKAVGRTLYDNLRTKYDVPHGDAWRSAYVLYGPRVTPN